MRILIIKISSMGDVIHTLPAVSDLIKNYPNAKIDWVIEEAFVSIAKAHPGINKIMPIAIRRWRRNFGLKAIQEFKKFLSQLREVKYDYVIDPQGLLKSALLTCLVKYNDNSTKSHGYDSNSIRGKYISWIYQNTYYIKKDQHAVYKIKQFFSKVFNYHYRQTVDYGIINKNNINNIKPYLVFLHCTTWDSKKWPVESWRSLIKIANNEGYIVKLNSGNKEELTQAHQIAQDLGSKVIVMEPQSIDNLVNIIKNSSGVVCVDTGLGHLAGALNKPGIAIFGATNSVLTGVLSDNFTNLQAQYFCSPCLLKNCDKLSSPSQLYPPCFDKLTPELVWSSLKKAITSTTSKN